MVDDIVLNKAEIIERCVARVREIYAGDPKNLVEDQLRQDAMVLNLQRTTEAAIDLGMHLTRVHRLGIPQESRDAFSLLESAGMLDADLAERLRRMVGFRNVAVHDYRKLDLDIVQSIIERGLDDVSAFASWAVRQHGTG